MQNGVRILLIEDCPLLSEGICTVLAQRSAMQIVGIATTATEAVDKQKRLLPDVALVGLPLTPTAGLHALRLLRARQPAIRLLALSLTGGNHLVYQAFEAGANAFLLKDVSVLEFLRTLEAVAQGENVRSDYVVSHLACHQNYPTLTQREQEILQRLAWGLPYGQIGADLFITKGTVKAHVNNVFKKLQVTDRTQAVVTALRRGIVHLD